MIFPQIVVTVKLSKAQLHASYVQVHVNAPHSAALTQIVLRFVRS